MIVAVLAYYCIRCVFGRIEVTVGTLSSPQFAVWRRTTKWNLNFRVADNAGQPEVNYCNQVFTLVTFRLRVLSGIYQQLTMSSEWPKTP